jgi:hypothetical protein
MNRAVSIILCAFCIVFIIGHWPIYLCPDVHALVDQACVQEIKDFFSLKESKE